MIPLTAVQLSEAAIEAATVVLRSGMLVQGERVQLFEAALAQRTARRHAIATSSGTGALELALRALQVGPGHEVLCPALTWPSPAHAIRSRGAVASLVDVHGAQWNVTAEGLASARTARTQAAVVIEQFGSPADHDAIARALPDLPVIVDAACALGSALAETPCGHHGTIACLSFHPRKILTTGEGGACLTDDDELAEKLRALRNHGQREPGQFVCAAGNQRMTEMAAAIGLAELPGLDGRITRRRELAAHYRQVLDEHRLQRALETARPNYQTFGVLVGEADDGGAKRDRVIQALRTRGVGAGILSYALQQLPQLREEAEAARRQGRELTRATEVASRGIALPLYEGMTDADAEHVVSTLVDVIAST